MLCVVDDEVEGTGTVLQVVVGVVGLTRGYRRWSHCVAIHRVSVLAKVGPKLTGLFFCVRREIHTVSTRTGTSTGTLNIFKKYCFNVSPPLAYSP
jgi:hypothetical protein